MTIEEVIAIAKTLRPSFTEFIYDARTKRYKLAYDTRIMPDDYVVKQRFSGFTVEEALRNAGWKG